MVNPDFLDDSILDHSHFVVWGTAWAECRTLSILLDLGTLLGTKIDLVVILVQSQHFSFDFLRRYLVIEDILTIFEYEVIKLLLINIFVFIFIFL